MVAAGVLQVVGVRTDRGGIVPDHQIEEQAVAGRIGVGHCGKGSGGRKFGGLSVENDLGGVKKHLGGILRSNCCVDSGLLRWGNTGGGGKCRYKSINCVLFRRRIVCERNIESGLCGVELGLRHRQSYNRSGISAGELLGLVDLENPSRRREHVSGQMGGVGVAFDQRAE